jgi:hypothetical protein
VPHISIFLLLNFRLIKIIIKKSTLKILIKNIFKMKKNCKTICLLTLLVLINLISFGQDKKNIVGIGAGMSPTYEFSVWIGNPANIWVTKNSGMVLDLFYARQVREGIRLGTYLEYESAKYEQSFGDVTRFNFGCNFISQYPNTPIHLQFGGFVGYGFLSASNWDQSLSGSDVGIMVGPAYENEIIGIAFHVQYGKAYYTSGGAPDEVGFAIPRFLVKVYYIF